jgi:type VI secretion system secreted protein Hcp
MAIDNFLRLDGIEGEATQKDHRAEIELLSWSWGMSNESAAGGSGSGSGAGRAKPQALLVVHRYDKASPRLLHHAASGRHIATAVLSARRRGAGARDFLKITLKEVLITGLQMADNGDGPVEQVSFSFAEIGFDYSPQTAQGGVGAPVKVNWNVRSSQVS